jgi:hypothetical protein
MCYLHIVREGAELDYVGAQVVHAGVEWPARVSGAALYHVVRLHHAALYLVVHLHHAMGVCMRYNHLLAVTVRR